MKVTKEKLDAVKRMTRAEKEALIKKALEKFNWDDNNAMMELIREINISISFAIGMLDEIECLEFDSQITLSLLRIDNCLETARQATNILESCFQIKTNNNETK